MSIYNILVAFNGTHSAIAALKYAASLARDKAHVTAILAHSTHEVVNSQGAWVPDAARKIIAQANKEIFDAVEARFKDIQNGLNLGDRLTFQRVPGRVDTVLAESARCYDLLIVGQDNSDRVDEHVMIHPDRIALMSGRPVLIVPRDYDAQAKHAHAAIAWDGGRAAARALSDSLGLLEDKGRVTIVTIGDTPTPRPVSELLDHLSRHGVTATHSAIKAVPGVARALIAYCREQDPCLLVMGAYEHSKFREDLFGGVTARVLKEVPIPVLLSH